MSEFAQQSARNADDAAEKIGERQVQKVEVGDASGAVRLSEDGQDNWNDVFMVLCLFSRGPRKGLHPLEYSILFLIYSIFGSSMRMGIFDLP